jgi:hypothetical protein
LEAAERAPSGDAAASDALAATLHFQERNSSRPRRLPNSTTLDSCRSFPECPQPAAGADRQLRSPNVKIWLQLIKNTEVVRTTSLPGRTVDPRRGPIAVCSSPNIAEPERVPMLLQLIKTGSRSVNSAMASRKMPALLSMPRAMYTPSVHAPCALSDGRPEARPDCGLLVPKHSRARACADAAAAH